MRVVVTSSPYHRIRSGSVGRVVAEKHERTRAHVYRVEVRGKGKDTHTGLFFSDELRVL